MKNKRAISIGYHGNVVDLWQVLSLHRRANNVYCCLLLKKLLLCRERVAEEHKQTGNLLVELGSDQTSLHNPFHGGYIPVQVSIPQCSASEF